MLLTTLWFKVDLFGGLGLVQPTNFEINVGLLNVQQIFLRHYFLVKSILQNWKVFIVQQSKTAWKSIPYKKILHQTPINEKNIKDFVWLHFCCNHNRQITSFPCFSKKPLLQFWQFCDHRRCSGKCQGLTFACFRTFFFVRNVTLSGPDKPKPIFRVYLTTSKYKTTKSSILEFENLRFKTTLTFLETGKVRLVLEAWQTKTLNRSSLVKDL